MSRLIRYVVDFPNGVSVGYHTGLGTKTAWGYALETARIYGGRLAEEDADGNFEVVRDWSTRKRSTSTRQPSSDQESPEGAVEIGVEQV